MPPILIPDSTGLVDGWVMILAQLGERLGLDPETAKRVAADVFDIHKTTPVSSAGLGKMLNAYLNATEDVTSSTPS